MARSTPYLFAVSLLFATALFADNNYVAQDWQKKIEASSAALKRGQHARSLRLANRLITDMIEKLGPGQSETHTFAVVVVHKAVASAGLGKLDDARWYWHVAIGIEPALAKVDLTPFGDAGRLVSAMDVREVEEPGELQARPMTPDTVPPKVLKSVDPVFPLAAAVFKVGGILIVEAVVTADGRTLDPAVLKPLPAPTLTYVALEALRRWRYEGGMVDGKVVPLLVKMTVHYRI
ncbi:MAG TPA: energy transducer TonB [Thermoanaerobaculia bacterium]|jgi:hypothetical protein